MNRLPRHLALLIPLVLGCFVLSPQARAVCQKGCDTSTANTFLGEDALVNNTTGINNTATGASALFTNTEGSSNTADGAIALFSNTTGSFNTATGDVALFSNTIGSENTAMGYAALGLNRTGSFNTATGDGALGVNNTGNDNTANGLASLANNATGSENTAIGSGALISNTDGNNNTATGYAAFSGLVGGSNNIALGAEAGGNLHEGDNNIDIGNVGFGRESNVIRIGTQGTQTEIFIAGISGASGTGTPVVVNGNGRLGVRPSSQRFKTEVKPMDKASEAILALKPVTFRYKKEIDPDNAPEFGLVAEDVEKVNPDLVTRDERGKPYSVRYEAVNVMLLNEFLKEHHKNEQQRKDFEAAIAQQQRQIDALTAGLQKVSAQLQLSKAAPQTVLNSY